MSVKSLIVFALLLSVSVPASQETAEREENHSDEDARDSNPQLEGGQNLQEVELTGQTVVHGRRRVEPDHRVVSRRPISVNPNGRKSCFIREGTFRLNDSLDFELEGRSGNPPLDRPDERVDLHPDLDLERDAGLRHQAEVVAVLLLVGVERAGGELLEEGGVGQVEVREGDVGGRVELAGRDVHEAVGQVEVGVGERVEAEVLRHVGHVANQGLVEGVLVRLDPAHLGLRLVV